MFFLCLLNGLIDSVNLLTFDLVIEKGALSWYGKLTRESAHAWNLIILCLLIVWGMTFKLMVHLSFFCNSIANL